ncbi:hypothetical protein NFI96_018026 [Prochilodus magdalenae]|nr:hypothetical protein NFI96_018026 [Prochilodus magdalenae]
MMPPHRTLPHRTLPHRTLPHRRCWLEVLVDVSGEGSQSGGQFQGRPSEVWSQWQSQHHSQQTGEQHTHTQPSQSEVFQDMLPMAGDPTQGTANYNIEDFADLGMFPPFSETPTGPPQSRYDVGGGSFSALQ